MTQTDKHTLRKFEFPSCAKEALPRIENIIISRSKQNIAMQLISEFIFLERAKDFDVRKGGGVGSLPPQTYASQMSSFQEFQLILVLIEFFSQPGPDATRNAVFLSLFGSNLTPQRAKVLCRLVSTAVSGSVAPLLSAAGTWMQQVGSTTPPTLEVAASLVSDFITFSRRTSEQLKQLPLVAPHFAANLMTAVGELYMNDKRSSGGTLVTPPDALLDVFTDWVGENPALCLTAQQPLALPSGAIAMPVVTPLAGLIRWTVLAPLVSQHAAYSQLHLSLLQTLLEVSAAAVRTGNASCPPTALNAQHLMLIVTPLREHMARAAAAKPACEQSAATTSDADYEKCMERFAQAVQVALTANCIYGNIPQLLCALETLPAHALMQIVIKANKSR